MKRTFDFILAALRCPAAACQSKAVKAAAQLEASGLPRVLRDSAKTGVIQDGHRLARWRCAPGWSGSRAKKLQEATSVMQGVDSHPPTRGCSPYHHPACACARRDQRPQCPMVLFLFTHLLSTGRVGPVGEGALCGRQALSTMPHHIGTNQPAPLSLPALESFVVSALRARQRSGASRLGLRQRSKLQAYLQQLSRPVSLTRLRQSLLKLGLLQLRWRCARCACGVQVTSESQPGV